MNIILQNHNYSYLQYDMVRLKWLVGSQSKINCQVKQRYNSYHHKGTYPNGTL